MDIFRSVFMCIDILSLGENGFGMYCWEMTMSMHESIAKLIGVGSADSANELLK